MAEKYSLGEMGVSRMWKDYSASFIKKNRASSVSIMVAAFISALFVRRRLFRGRFLFENFQEEFMRLPAIFGDRGVKDTARLWQSI